MAQMEAYQSLSSRVASMEELLRRSESTVALILQRLKALEEHIAASEARHRGEDAVRSDGLSARLDAALGNQNGKLDALQNAVVRQGSATQVLEERMQGIIRALEQKLTGDLSGFYQRMQTTESSLAAAVRNVESALQSQSSSLKSVEQLLRGDMQSMEQRVNGELVSARQRVDGLDNGFRSALVEMHRSLSGDVKTLSDTFFGRLQSSTQSLETAVVGLDQKMQAEMKSIQGLLTHEVATTRQNMSAQDAATRDALQGLHSTLASDITNLLSRLQAAEAAHQLAHQQNLAELASQRQLIETLGTNWRVGISDLSEKVKDDLQNVRAQQAAADASVQQRFSQTTTHIDEVCAELRRLVESFAHPLQIKVKSLEQHSENVTSNMKVLQVVREEQQRMRGEFQSFSTLAERSAVQLRTLMETAFRASHNDLIERLKPLAAYRTEMHTAITVSLKKLWDEACNLFVPRRDIEFIQHQIQVLDRAVRNEVTLLAEKGRSLERRAEDKGKSDASAKCCTPPSAEKGGTLVPMPVFGELNSMWGELRDIQKNLGMPKEEVISAIRGSRQEVIDVALEAMKKNENEFRNVLVQIENSVRKLAPVVQGRRPHSTEDNRGDSRNPNTNGTGTRLKKTIVRLRSTEDTEPTQGDELQILRISKSPHLPQMLQSKSMASLPVLKGAGASAREVRQSSPKAAEVAGHLPPLVHSLLPRLAREAAGGPFSCVAVSEPLRQAEEKP